MGHSWRKLLPGRQVLVCVGVIVYSTPLPPLPPLLPTLCLLLPSLFPDYSYLTSCLVISNIPEHRGISCLSSPIPMNCILRLSVKTNPSFISCQTNSHSEQKRNEHNSLPRDRFIQPAHWGSTAPSGPTAL